MREPNGCARARHTLPPHAADRRAAARRSTIPTAELYVSQPPQNQGFAPAAPKSPCRGGGPAMRGGLRPLFRTGEWTLGLAYPQHEKRHPVGCLAMPPRGLSRGRGGGGLRRRCGGPRRRAPGWWHARAHGRAGPTRRRGHRRRHRPSAASPRFRTEPRQR